MGEGVGGRLDLCAAWEGGVKCKIPPMDPLACMGVLVRVHGCACEVRHLKWAWYAS
jgi:hypothetical protein